MKALAYLFSAVAAIPLAIGCVFKFIGGIFGAVGLVIETWAWDVFVPEYKLEDDDNE